MALAPTALAHVLVAPPFVEAGVSTPVTFSVPNEREGRAVTSVELVAPPGVELEESTPPAGWSPELDRRTARWTGGRIEGAAFVGFPLVVTARTTPGTKTFRVTLGYDDGKTVKWAPQLRVLPAPAADAPDQRLGRALAAGVIGLLVVVGSLLLLRRLRRRPLQER